MNYEVKPNFYLDIDWKDRSKEVENAFSPTLEDIKNDPEFYAELVMIQCFIGCMELKKHH